MEVTGGSLNKRLLSSPDNNITNKLKPNKVNSTNSSRNDRWRNAVMKILLVQEIISWTLINRRI